LLWQDRHRNFKFKTALESIELLVSFRFRSSHQRVPQAVANFGIGTLALPALFAAICPVVLPACPAEPVATLLAWIHVSAIVDAS